MKNNICVSVSDGIDATFSLEKVQSFVEKVLSANGISNWEVSITLCSDAFMQDLNKNYRDIDSPTDVLSFENGSTYPCGNGSTYPCGNGSEMFCAGDIVISIPALFRNCNEFAVSPNDEIKRLLVHGILHLDGMDHGEFHIGKDGTILDENEKVPIYANLSQEHKDECDMLVAQEEILYKFVNEIIVEEQN